MKQECYQFNIISSRLPSENIPNHVWNLQVSEFTTVCHWPISWSR